MYWVSGVRRQVSGVDSPAKGKFATYDTVSPARRPIYVFINR